MPRTKDPMKKNLKKSGVLLDPRTKAVMDRWADEEGRSLQMHLGVLARKLVTLRETKPEVLAQLGLLMPDHANQPLA